MSTALDLDTEANAWLNCPMTPTGSKKIDTLVERARALGLEVTVEVRDSDFCGEPNGYRNVKLEIRRPQVEVENMLDQVRNADRIHASWGWVRENGCTPKQVYARKDGLYGSGYDISARTLRFAIDGLAR